MGNASGEMRPINGACTGVTGGGSMPRLRKRVSAAGTPGTVARVARQVCICSADPLASAGVAFHLQREGPIVLVSADTVHANTIVIAVSEALDDRVTIDLVNSVRSGARALVLVVDELDAAALVRAIGLGVRGVVWRREAGGDEVCAAVAAVAAGHAWFPPELLGDLVDVLSLRSTLWPTPTSGAVYLSEREEEVMRLLAEGFGTGEIAHRLAYSERTIKAVLHGVTKRLQLRNRTHAVAYLVRHGFL